MKKLICILLAALMVLALAACGAQPQETTKGTTAPPETTLPPETTQPPLTAKWVAEQMVQAVDGKTMTGGTVAISFGFTMIVPESEEEEPTETTIEMAMVMDMKLSADPVAMYADSQISMKMTGLDVSYGTESYMVMEDGQLVNYTHMLLDDSWTKTSATAAQMSEMNQEADYSWLLAKDDAALTLTDGIQLLNGREVYVLNCVLTGEEMQKTMDSSAGAGDSLAELGISAEDFAALRVPTVYYIDAHTFYPVEAQMNVEGFDTLINGIFSSTLGMDPETAGVQIKTGEMTMSMTNMSFDPVEVPPVPQEAYGATANAGVYQLTEEGKTVQVNLPLGWVELEAEEDALSLVSSDYAQSALIAVFADVTGMDFAALIEEGDVASLKQSGEYIGHGMGEPIGDYQTMWIQADSMNIYYAWGSVGDAYVYVHIVDTTGLTLEEALTPLLSAISIPAAE